MLSRILASAVFAVALLLGACDAPEGEGPPPEQPTQQ